jgi:leucyl-tRNA synthetase
MDYEAKWQAVWAEEKLFEPEADAGKKKFFLTAAFPYPNSPQHIGHGRTYTTTDVYARYMRMQGRNVLFPMGFHVTGTPILAMARRLKEQDNELLEIFEKIYHIPRETALSLSEPVPLVTYFSQEIEQGMKEMGYSIDWRRKFYSFDAHFNKFIQWQFAKLKEKGYLVQGEHPVPWCPKDGNSIGSHDTQGDVDPQLEEVTAIKFAFKDGSILVSTYRPETIYGVTNIWVNSNSKIVLVRNTKTNERYYMAEQAAKVLSYQLPLQIEQPIPVNELLGSNATNPETKEQVPIFQASFVKPSVGTGIVMSVPAHAPLDYLALRDAGLDDRIALKQVLSVEGFGSFPAKELCDEMRIQDQNDAEAENATKEIYKKEAHTGKMVVGKYAGKTGLEAKELVTKSLISSNMAFKFTEISNQPVYCRCGTHVVVKRVSDQWFIDYGNPSWKEQVKSCFSKMRILPQKTIPDYLYTIDWLREKACTRASGLGTCFPFSENQMIEALSDSTIYMAFYTISHILKKENASELNNAFFDYVLLGVNEDLASERMRQLRKEFLYWYPLDSRHSATDLVHNHLTYLIFNHAAVFPPELWPKQIVSNGFVMMEGQKMSKSFGNILPIRAAIKQYGADVVRFLVVSGADLPQDSDFNKTGAEGAAARIRQMLRYAHEAAKEKEKQAPGSFADRWLASKLHSKVKNAPALYESFQMRELSQALFYDAINELSYYQKRAPTPHLREFMEYWALLIAPIMPHASDEIFSVLGTKLYVAEAKFASVSPFPKPDESRINPRLEKAEGLVKGTLEDIRSILTLLKIAKAKSVTLCCASDWKRVIYETVRQKKKADEAIKAIKDGNLVPNERLGNAIALAIVYAKNLNSLDASLPTQAEELEALTDAVKYLENELGGCSVIVAAEEKAQGAAAAKAKNANPMKPSIYIEK